MKKRKLLKQSKKLVAVVTAVALLDAPAAYAADGATSETAQYHAEESFDSVSDVSEYAQTESQVQQTEEESIQTESITETEAAEEEVTTVKATVGETETATRDRRSRCSDSRCGSADCNKWMGRRWSLLRKWRNGQGS